MTNTYTWLIKRMDCYPQHEGETDVVFTVHWRCNATDGTYDATQYGSVNVPYKPGEPYTPYADLTQEQVLGWVWAVTPEADTQAYLDNQLNAETLPLPWSA